jgi:hypothetical protein
MFEQQQQQVPVSKDSKSLPLLMEELTQVECAVLGQTVNTPGWRVVYKLMDAACTRANKAVMDVDPESAGADKVVIERQRMARNMSLFFSQVMKAIDFHIKSIQRVQQEEEIEAAVAVSKTLGFNLANPKESIEAVTKTFGIHPAKPKKTK